MKRSLDNSWRALMILAEIIVLIAMPYLGLVPEYDSWVEGTVVVALTVVIGSLLVVAAIMLVVSLLNTMMEENCHSEKAEDKFLVVVTVILVFIGAMLYAK